MLIVDSLRFNCSAWRCIPGMLLGALLAGDVAAQQVIVEETFGDGGVPDQAGWTAFAGQAEADEGDAGAGDHAVQYFADGPAQPGFHFLHPASGQSPNPALQGDLRVYDDISVLIRQQEFDSELELRLYVFNFSGDWAISTQYCSFPGPFFEYRYCGISLDADRFFATSGPAAETILANVRQIGFRHDPFATGPGVPVPVTPGTRAFFDDVQLTVDISNCDSSVWAAPVQPVPSGDTFSVEIFGDFGNCGMATGSIDLHFDATRFSSPDFTRVLPVDAVCFLSPDCIVLDDTGTVSVFFRPPRGIVYPDSGVWHLGTLSLRAILPGASELVVANSDVFSGVWNSVIPNLVDPPSFDGTSITVTESDADNDGVLDSLDNCLGLTNPAQIDADFDGIGNPCDQDLDNDCAVTAVDLGLFRARFFSADPVADFNSDGVVNALDLGFLRSAFFQAPGPSGLANACD